MSGSDDIRNECTTIHGDIVEEVDASMPEPEKIFELADFFKVFGDSTRLKIIWALDIHEMCVCDIAALLGMTKSAVSHQLRSLRQAKLVRTRREGKVVFYRLSDDHVRKIFEKAVEHLEEEQQ